MLTLMADHNAEGHLEALLTVWSRPDWHSFWQAANSFESLQLSADASDEIVWRVCQSRDILLLTCNRNADDEDSLEEVIRRQGTSTSLPVFTIADPDRLIRDRDYVERTAARLLEYIYDLENIRGTGRLFVP